MKPACPPAQPHTAPATAQPACTLSLERWRMEPNSRPRMEVMHKSSASAPCLWGGGYNRTGGCNKAATVGVRRSPPLPPAPLPLLPPFPQFKLSNTATLHTCCRYRSPSALQGGRHREPAITRVDDAAARIASSGCTWPSPSAQPTSRLPPSHPSRRRWHGGSRAAARPAWPGAAVGDEEAWEAAEGRNGCDYGGNSGDSYI